MIQNTLFILDSRFGRGYFRGAMDYFREEFDNVIFLYVSDDMEWGRRNLRALGEGDLFFAGGRSAGEVRHI